MSSILGYSQKKLAYLVQIEKIKAIQIQNKILSFDLLNLFIWISIATVCFGKKTGSEQEEPIESFIVYIFAVGLFSLLSILNQPSRNN